MVKKRIKITTRRLVSIAARKPYGQFCETFDHIPARTLRGAFALLLLRECRMSHPKQAKCDECPSEIAENCEFHNIIGKSELLRFGDCYAVYPEYQGDTHTVIPRILPATAVSCKYHPGFSTGYAYYLYHKLADTKDEEPHGVFDLLAKQVIYDELESPNYVYKPKCPSCDGIVEPFSGHYQMTPKGDIYFRSEARTRRFGRSAMNRKTWAAQEGMLYSVQTISENNVFLGNIELDENADDHFIDKAIEGLEELNSIGGRASSGLGNVEIEVEDYEPAVMSVANRIEELNRVLDEIRGKSISKIYFTVDLESDTILRGLIGEPLIQLDENLLMNHLSCVNEDFDSECFDNYGIKLERSYSAGMPVGGWSTAWDLPKYVELATVKGSVFLFSASAIDNTLCNYLENLELKGIGERLEEGFGKISICEQFHLEVEPK